MSLHEIPVGELNKYVDPWSLEKEWAIACAADGRETNGLTIAWGGFGILWNKPTVTVYVHKTRYSKHIFDGAKYFSVCFLKAEDRKVLEYFGSVSGRDEDKMAGCGKEIVTDAPAPYFADSRAVILCEIMGKSDFDAGSVDEGVRGWYQRDGVHTQYYGKVVRVLVSGQ